MKIEAEVLKVSDVNSTHIVRFRVEGIPMHVGIFIENGKLCGSGFVQKDVKR
jgi:hypothetical protein